MTSLREIELRPGEEAAEGARQKEEWNDWEERHRTESCEGNSERHRGMSEFQLRRKSGNGASGVSDIEHVAIGNRAGRRQRS
jgi:hypothetical protein